MVDASQVINIEKLLLKCPLLQNLTLEGDYKYHNEIFLTDLKYLKVQGWEESNFENIIASILKPSKSSVKTLHLKFPLKEIMNCTFTEIPELDTVWIEVHFTQDTVFNSEALNQVLKLFPKNVEVIYKVR